MFPFLACVVIGYGGLAFLGWAVVKVAAESERRLNANRPRPFDYEVDE